MVWGISAPILSFTMQMNNTDSLVSGVSQWTGTWFTWYAWWISISARTARLTILATQS
jgi:hypothetical protein